MAIRIWIWKKVEKSETGGFFTSVLNLNMQTWECAIEPAGFEKLTSYEHIRISTVDEINRSMQRLQPIPWVALKILRIINEDNYDITTLTAEMRKDQVLSARTIKLCNSVYFRSRNKIESVKSFPDIVDMIPVKVLGSSPEMALMSD